ncbi:hypothetical protein OG568_49760 (plasmid) [Streptomyces sp. NBC_01450]|uniref:hypothetical protein n=1 Tax=Streptomyces sp. NBC_01450 TaxID=2903871 RepID=UPI002E31B986|nr:hypothetical protein [Streptomyces sp. NBC_01450]
MNASAVTSVITGGLLGAVADAPWWGSCAVVVIIFGIGHATQLVDAWNKLRRGPHERRALREAQAADVLAYFSQTHTGTPAQPLTDTSAVDPPADAGTT